MSNMKFNSVLDDTYASSMYLTNDQYSEPKRVIHIIKCVSPGFFLCKGIDKRTGEVDSPGFLMQGKDLVDYNIWKSAKIDAGTGRFTLFDDIGELSFVKLGEGFGRLSEIKYESR